MKWILSIISVVLLLALGCSAGKPTSQQPTNAISSPFYADYEIQTQVYHQSADSSTVYIKLSSQLLSRRRISDLDGCYALQLKVLVIDSVQRILDTVDARYKSCLVPEAAFLLLEERIYMPQGQYKLVLEMADGYRNSISREIIDADKRTSFGSQNFKLVNSDGEFIFGNTLLENQRAILMSDRNIGQDSIEVVHFRAETKLPPPPFSSNKSEVPDLKNAQFSTLAFVNGRVEVNSLEEFQWMRIGKTKEGFVLRNALPSFPEITEAKQLYQPLRYITTKAEYDEMSKTNYSKPLVDQFWIESGASKERAKDLIRIYYSRVEKANRYFSSHTEGWRTDRGMIYLVFGQPVEIEEIDTQIKWYYGSKNDDNVIVFTFNRQVNPIGQYQYNLKRDPYFKTSWEAMVNAWRNGRIRE